MQYPGYQLNPGDMFQVDMERVLQATGRPKQPQLAEKMETILQRRLEKLEARDAKQLARRQALSDEMEAKLQSHKEDSGESLTAASTPAESEDSGEAEAELADASAKAEAYEASENFDPVKRDRAHVKSLIKYTKSILDNPSGELSVKKKQQLRIFVQEAKRVMSRIGNPAAATDSTSPMAPVTSKQIMDDFSALLSKLNLEGDQDSGPTEDQGAKSSPGSKESEKVFKELSEESKEKATRMTKGLTLSKAEQARLARLLKADEENPVDETKPYMTPWQPRKYMAPFAFIPRYLEVNQNICAGIYLRHPVARRGMAEVPTPFNYETNQLAFNWYLRRS
jgi:hypothetical protein